MIKTFEQLNILQERKYLDEFISKLLVYKITNIINNKIYIGITSRIKRRVVEHIKYSTDKSACTSYVHKSMSKYGLRHFIFEIIYIANNTEELNSKEEYYINYYKSSESIYGYNLTLGGDRGIPNSDTILKKIASSNKVKVAKYDLQGNLLESFNSIKEAERATGILDTDIHRCCKKKYSRNRFMFQKFTSDSPLEKIEPYIDNTGINFRIKGRITHNRVACSLINNETKEVISASNIEELARLSGLNKTTLHKLKQKQTKKWQILI